MTSARSGRESRFAYRPEPVADVRSWLDMVSAQWDDALSRLKLFVEECGFCIPLLSYVRSRPIADIDNARSAPSLLCETLLR